MFSVLILTFNEELDLPGCLSSLCWCDDVVVFDSYSTDLTEYIAVSSGAPFVRRPGQDLANSFGGDEAFHRTWALRHITFSHPWLLVLDADERLSSDALIEIQTTLHNHQCSFSNLLLDVPVAYQFRRRDYYQGRHLKHVQATPWYRGLFRPEFVHYERMINPVTVVNGSVGSLNGFIDHYPFSKGLTYWISRHNTYSTLEAKQSISIPFESYHLNFRGAFFSPYFYQRRTHQKLIFTYLPARPFIKFLFLYFFKRGFLDGGPGFTYALLQSIYELFIVLKVREMRELAQLSRLPPPS